MKLKIWSDIHLEFSDQKLDHLWKPSPEDKDVVLIIAGDFSTGVSGYMAMRSLWENFKEVLYVHGNHEYYGRDLQHTINEWIQIEQDAPNNFHFLYNDWREIDGIRFIGGTMWTSFNHADPLVMYDARRNMNDYNKIHDRGSNITPDRILEEHNKFVDYLESELAKPFEGKTVVITHHSPGNGMRLREGYNSVDYCYFADLEELINENNINLWFHGHLHESQNYLIDNTRIICNPYGYYGYALNQDFNKDIIIEI